MGGIMTKLGLAADPNAGMGSMQESIAIQKESLQMMKDVAPSDYAKIESYIRDAAAVNPELAGLFESGEIDEATILAALENPEIAESIGLQREALAPIREAMDEGLTGADKARLEEVRRRVAGDVKAREASMMSSMAERGQLGGGQELAMKLASQQQAAQQQSDLAESTAQQASAGRMAAAGQMAQQAGQMRGQAAQAAGQKASAQQSIAQFNSANRMQQQAAKQQEAHRKAGQQQQMYSQLAALEGTKFGEAMSKAGGVNTAAGGVAQSMANMGAAQAAGAQAQAGAAMGAVGAGAMAMSDKRLKDEIKKATSSKIDELFDKAPAYEYEYKGGDKKHTSPMAQDLEKSELGKHYTVETPAGKAVDYGKAAGAMFAAISDLRKEVKELKSKNKSMSAADGGIRRRYADGSSLEDLLGGSREPMMSKDPMMSREPDYSKDMSKRFEGPMPQVQPTRKPSVMPSSKYSTSLDSDKPLPPSMIGKGKFSTSLDDSKPLPPDMIGKGVVESGEMSADSLSDLRSPGSEGGDWKKALSAFGKGLGASAGKETKPFQVADVRPQEISGGDIKPLDIMKDMKYSGQFADGGLGLTPDESNELQKVRGFQEEILKGKYANGGVASAPLPLPGATPPQLPPMPPQTPIAAAPVPIPGATPPQAPMPPAPMPVESQSYTSPEENAKQALERYNKRYDTLHQKFAEGGVPRGMNYEAGGEGTIIDSGEDNFTGDELSDRINDEEMVLNVEQQDRIYRLMQELAQLKQRERTDDLLEEGERDVDSEQQEALMQLARGERDVSELPKGTIVKDTDDRYEDSGDMPKLLSMLGSKRNA